MVQCYWYLLHSESSTSIRLTDSLLHPRPYEDSWRKPESQRKSKANREFIAELAKNFRGPNKKYPWFMEVGCPVPKFVYTIWDYPWSQFIPNLTDMTRCLLHIFCFFSDWRESFSLESSSTKEQSFGRNRFLGSVFIFVPRNSFFLCYLSFTLFKVPIVNHWWQTETAHAITSACVGLGNSAEQPSGSVGFPVPGFDGNSKRLTFNYN